MLISDYVSQSQVFHGPGFMSWVSGLALGSSHSPLSTVVTCETFIIASVISTS